MSIRDDRIRFTFRIPGELYSRMKSESDKMGVSINALMLKILWDWSEMNDRNTTKKE